MTARYLNGGGRLNFYGFGSLLYRGLTRGLFGFSIGGFYIKELFRGDLFFDLGGSIMLLIGLIMYMICALMNVRGNGFFPRVVIPFVYISISGDTMWIGGMVVMRFLSSSVGFRLLCYCYAGFLF